MALKFSMILEAIDRASAPAKRVRQGIAGLTAGSRKFGAQLRRQSRDVDSGARSLEHYQRRARRLRSVALGRIFQAGADSARRMARDVRKLTSQLKLAERAGKATMRGMKWLGGAALNTAKWAAAAGAAAGGFALYDMFNDAGKAEVAREELAAFLGSAAAARREFERLKSGNFAVPIGELLTEFVALRKAGIEPTDKAIRTIADEARNSKKSFGDMVQLLKEVRGGDFGSLEGIGIKVANNKGVLALTYLDKEGKRVSRSVRNTADEIEGALMDIFDARSGGASARYQKTWFGLIDGIRNRWNRFQLMVADAGIFDTVKAKADEWMARLDLMAKDGRLKKWAEVISDKLQKAFDWAVKFVENTDWDAVANDLARIGEAAKVVADAILSIAENWGPVSAIANYSISDLSSDLRNLMGGGKAKAPASGAAAKRAPAKRGPARGSDRWRRNPATLPSAASKAMLQIGGRTEVDIKVHGPASATVRSARSVNQSIPSVVRVGKTMQAAA